MSDPKDPPGRVIGRVNGGVPLVGKIVDLGAHRPKDPLQAKIEKAEVDAREKARIERWGDGFEEAVAAGPVDLLAFLLSGNSYDETNVKAFAASVLAAMTAGGYLVAKRSEIRAMIEQAIGQVREGKPTEFDPQGESNES